MAQCVAEQKSEDPHFKAVLAQLTVTNNFYLGLIHMVANENGLAAEALLRSLFDSAVNCIILAKHKEKLQDFLRNGHFMHLRLIRFSDIIKERFTPLLEATEKEWKELIAEFKNTDWHKLGTRDSFVEAEYEPQIYDQFFRRASAYAHAEPFIVVRRPDNTWKNWTIEARPELWKKLGVGVYGMASMAMLHMLAILNREFNLGIEEEFARAKAVVDEFKAKHIQVMNQILENQDNKAGPSV
jgi:hypothetical protein